MAENENRHRKRLNEHEGEKKMKRIFGPKMKQRDEKRSETDSYETYKMK